MKSSLIVIDNLTDLLNLRSYLQQFEFVAYDCETTGLTKRDRVIGFSVCAEEDKAFYIILEKWDNGKLTPMPYLIEARDFILSLQSKKLLMHNATFDCYMAEAYFKIDLISSVHTDTMILAHLLNENRRVGLKELSASIFGEDSTTESKEMKDSVLANGGKLTKDCYEMYKCDSYIMGKYGAKDAFLTFKLFNHLIPELLEQNLDSFFYDDESMPLLRGPTYDLNTTGLQVDTQTLTSLRKTLEAECAEAKAFIYQEIREKIRDKYPGTTKANTFNIGACQQLSWLLFGQYGLEFNTLTKAGKTACKALGMKLPYMPTAKRSFIAECLSRKDEKITQDCSVNGRIVKGKKLKDPWAYIAADKNTLKKFAPKLKWVERLLEYQRKMKLLSTYVEGIEERMQYGVIQPSFLQHGTSSGRYSSRNPNFQNLPRDDKRIKACIVARPGKVYVGADYSQLEPRVFAYTSKDERLLKAFTEDSDFYSVVGMETYDRFDCVPSKEELPNSFKTMHKKLRQDTKVFVLASTYGATGHQLAPMMGKTSDKAQEDIDAYFEKFPAVANMMKESHEMAKRDGQVVNIFGRPRRIPDAKRINKLYGVQPHADLPYEARKLLNLSVNHRIQSTAASIVNRAMIKLYSDMKEHKIEAKIVLQVHDSIIVECLTQDAEIVSLLLRNAMENTVKLDGIELEAVPRIGYNLSEV